MTRPGIRHLVATAAIAVACLAPAAAPAQTQMPPEFRAQVRAVAMACRADIRQYCSGVQRGEGRIFACLQENEASLSTACRDALANPPVPPEGPAPAGNGG